MNKKAFLKMGLMSILMFSTGCSNKTESTVGNEDLNVKTEVINNKKETNLDIKKEYDEENKIIRYAINSSFKPEILNWSTMKELFNLNENDYKKDVFRDEISYEEVNIREKNYIEHSFDVLKNDNIAVFVGQEHGLDKWSIKIGMNEINEEVVYKYFMPAIKEVFNNENLAKKISEESINALKELDDNYVLGSMESFGNNFSIMVNKSNINTKDITMFDSPNIYTYNIELRY